MSFKEAKKKFLRRVALAALPPVASVLIKIIYFTSKKEFHLPEEKPQEPLIFAFWHGELLMQTFTYYKYRNPPKLKMMISEHFDGKIIAKTNEYFGLEALHGSSTRGGVRVLINGIKALKNGFDVGITPDGPKGPRHSVSDGVILLAQKTSKKIVILNYKADNYWQLKSWDKFLIPKPFTTIHFYASEPIDIQEMELQEARNFLYEKLMIHAV